MESQDNTSINPVNTPAPNQPIQEYPSNRSGRIMGGVVIIAVGLLFFARQLGTELPVWLFSWPMFLVGLGIFIGARHSFRDFKWLIPVLIGLAFLVDDFWVEVSLKQYIWPIVLIVIGMAMIFRPRRTRRPDQPWGRRWENRYTSHTDQAAEDFIECVTIFGGVKKNIISKDFRGGEAVTFFGGTELNLTQADVNDKIVLDLVQVFGGTKLIVPPHWKIHSEELVSIFGGLNDKRPLAPAADHGPQKVLILKGTCIFGGIDIKSY